MNRYRLLPLALVLAVGLPGTVAALALLWTGAYSDALRWTLSAALLLAWLAGAFFLRAQIHRPLRTVSSMLAALRAGDYSIRARHAGASDPLALVFMEINALEEQFREQRLGAVEAQNVLQRVLAEIDVAVMAFDQGNGLRVVNRAAERLLGDTEARLLGRTATELGINEALESDAPRTMARSEPTGPRHWQVRRSVIRQQGERLTLVVMTDLERTLRDEERQAWRRLVRVLSHEINNSLAPIKSITASVQDLLNRAGTTDWAADAQNGLAIVATRAESLRRFLASYARLARLPPPSRADVDVETWVRHVAGLETRLPVTVRDGESTQVPADRDQLDQALINLVANAVDATLQTGGAVEAYWQREGRNVVVTVDDEGPGLADGGNLFVPFYTTKPDGSGIGLVLSQHIAENHGGSLTLKNREDGKGARARLSLPVA